eukprot:jgi/Mesvir1/10347/Mv10548-RA.1
MRCSECRELGTRDLEGVRFCECHAPPGSRNVALHPCVVCGLDDILDASGRCPTCDPDRAAKIAKRHEMQVKAFLDSEIAAGSLPAYETHDRMIDGGACVRVRPDFVWDAATHMVVLEVDENQHMQYACECEQARMANVGQAMGMPTLFIRYNPDGFRADDGGRARKRSASLLKRMETLKSYLRWCARPEASPGNHGAFVRAVYLYYDGWTDAAPEWRTVVPLCGGAGGGAAAIARSAATAEGRKEGGGGVHMGGGGRGTGGGSLGAFSSPRTRILIACSSSKVAGSL